MATKKYEDKVTDFNKLTGWIYEKEKGWKHFNFPASLRYCIFCRKITKFRFNKDEGHSKCDSCGNAGTGRNINSRKARLEKID